MQLARDTGNSIRPFVSMGYGQGSPNRWEPVRFDRLPIKPIRPGSGLGRYQTGPNSKFKFEFKKMKNSQKNSKNTSRCDEYNGVKFSKKIHSFSIVCGDLKLNKKTCIQKYTNTM